MGFPVINFKVESSGYAADLRKGDVKTMLRVAPDSAVAYLVLRKTYDA